MNLPADFPRSIGVSHSRGLSDSPYIAMTFDDGPHPKNTPRLLDMLRQRNIKATFYVIGTNVKMYPEITRRIVAEGHEIGNHTWTHPNLTTLSDSQVRSQMVATRDQIVQATGVMPRTVRPPYGALLTRQREMLFNEFGYPTIMWSVDPRDWQRPGVSVVRDRILSETQERLDRAGARPAWPDGRRDAADPGRIAGEGIQVCDGFAASGHEGNGAMRLSEP